MMHCVDKTVVGVSTCTCTGILFSVCGYEPIGKSPNTLFPCLRTWIGILVPNDVTAILDMLDDLLQQYVKAHVAIANMVSFVFDSRSNNTDQFSLMSMFLPCWKWTLIIQIQFSTSIITWHAITL
jgi:hypothetical protein